MKRCFLAISIPENILEEIVKLKHNMQKETRKLDVKIKWVEDKNMHITLKFLGNVDDADINALKNVVEKLVKSKREISCELHGLGFFPNEQNPRVIWVGIDSKNEIEQLAKEVNDLLNEVGFGRERNFVAHITMGRVKFGREKRRISEVLKQIRVRKLLFKVNEIRLIESKLTPKGPEYRTIEKFRLGG